MQNIFRLISRLWPSDVKGAIQIEYIIIIIIIISSVNLASFFSFLSRFLVKLDDSQLENQPNIIVFCKLSYIMLLSF